MKASRFIWAGALAAFTIQNATADGLRAGLWKIVTRPEINGVAGPDQESTRCLTEDEVNNLEATFSPNSRTTYSSCETTGQEATPQHLTWHLQCAGQIDMDVAGEFIFETRQHFTATISTHASMMGRQFQDSRALIEGRHVGTCP